MRAAASSATHLDVGVVGRQELGTRRPAAARARRANSLPASQAQSTEPSGSRRAESKATSPSCGVRCVELAARGVDEEEVVVEGRVRALHEDAVLRPVDHVRPAARLGQLAPLAAGDADDRDVEVDAVAARVRERDELARRARTRPGTWIASGSPLSAHLGAAVGVDREERVALVAAGVACDHPALVGGRGQSRRDALARRT